MKVNFVGSFTTGYVGESADECHLAREMEALGHVVRRLPRDEWREHVIEGSKYPNIPSDLKADINIVAKWNGFYDGRFIEKLREASGAPVFYWVWDYMQGEEWHMESVKSCDLYIANDVFSGQYKGLNNCYYFPFDVADGDLPLFQNKEKLYDVVFFGSYIHQGDRIEWIKEINKTHPVKVFSWNYEEWVKNGIDAEEAVYGTEFMEKVAQSKIMLGFSVHPNTWGYWSNRTGKTLLAKGFLLYQYAPGMELFFRNCIEYFSSVDEVNNKIDYYLKNDREREFIASRGYSLGREKFTSKARIEDLMILLERFIGKGKSVWKI